MTNKNQNLKNWLLRLLRKETKQAKGELKKDDNCFCCLGDLLEVCGIPSIDELANHHDISLYTYTYLEDEGNALLPNGVARDFLNIDRSTTRPFNLSYYDPLKDDKLSLNPAHLNDLLVSKHVIAILIWAILPLGQDMTETPLRKEIVEFYRSNKKQTHRLESLDKYVLSVIEEVKRIDDY